jgi:choline dehydrogenase
MMPGKISGNNSRGLGNNSDSTPNECYAVTAQFAERVRNNQARLTSASKPQYEIIVCWSGSSGSVVAGRLAENREVGLLLLEGGRRRRTSVTEANQWPMNLGSERDWSFQGQRNPRLK